MQIAIMDGVTMGCGGGISIPGMFRVATDKTVCGLILKSSLLVGFLTPFFLFYLRYCLMQVLAHPEVQIGFHPDAGASYYLSRLPGYLGELHF